MTSFCSMLVCVSFHSLMFVARLSWSKCWEASLTGAMTQPATKKAKVDPTLPKESEWSKTDAADYAEAVETHVWH